MSDRPNILLITTDQQRFDTLHAAGNAHIRTPHLNWLCDQGVRFSRCYSDAPVCIPARATIMTGRAGYRNGLTTNNDGVRPIDAAHSLPGMLTGGGYQTRAQGKMHFDPTRRNYGFEHMEITDDYYRYMAQHPHLGVPTDHGVGGNEMEPVISTVPESHSLTHWTVDRSIDFLETRDDARPFFLWTSFSKPHPPLDPCANYWLLYQNAEVPPPVYGDWSKEVGDVPLGCLARTCRLGSGDRFDERLIRDMRRAYYACITQIDYNLGLLFARMRELGLMENTLILFTSDHGEMLGDHHLSGKEVFLEGSAHVPMLMRLPSALQGDPSRSTVCEELTTLSDVRATCLAAAGVESDAGYESDGLSLLDVAEGTTRREFFVGVCGDLFAVIEGSHKYCYCAEGNDELLFDLESDPYEQKNLAGVAAMAERKADLRARLVDELASVRPEILEDGDLRVRKAPDIRSLRGYWPGFHSRVEPHDSLH